jgi:hypothetical protein
MSAWASLGQETGLFPHAAAGRLWGRGCEGDNVSLGQFLLFFDLGFLHVHKTGPPRFAWAGVSLCPAM